ncbi:MAG: zinc metallopeptidase, partial [Saprospiraceae bacterium]|nr:zinc metallopeptidase [Saprospiraceae bacterium]
MGLGLLVISGIFTVIGMILNSRLRSKFHKYAQIPLSNRMSGAEVARTMLKHYGIYDVQVIHVPGQLTDHYNPANKTVNLSDEVFESSSVAAAAVAAHECGHAVQHATAYSFLQVRSAIVPVVNFAAGIQQFVFMFGLAGAYLLNNIWIMLIVLVVFAITALFSLITLPVEFDASRRALAWLDE